jgi:hypothetical protein
MMTDVYRVTIQRPPLRLGLREYPRRPRVIPLATRQRLGCILAYQRELPEEDRAQITVERAQVGQFQPVELSEVVA